MRLVVWPIDTLGGGILYVEHLVDPNSIRLFLPYELNLEIFLVLIYVLLDLL